MGRKSQHTFTKRQREQKKAKKTADKLARRAARMNPSAPLPVTEEGGIPAGDDGLAAPN